MKKRELHVNYQWIRADYVKTSTGFSTAGAKVDDVKLMKSVVGDRLGIKASVA